MKNLFLIVVLVFSMSLFTVLSFLKGFNSSADIAGFVFGAVVITSGNFIFHFQR